MFSRPRLPKTPDALSRHSTYRNDPSRLGTKRRKEGSEVNGTLARRYPRRIVHHSRLGVWDWYEEQNPDNGRIAPSSALRKRFSELIECAPYLLRTIEDVLNIPGCRFHVIVFTLAEFGAGLIPALSLW